MLFRVSWRRECIISLIKSGFRVRVRIRLPLKNRVPGPNPKKNQVQISLLDKFKQE